MVSERTACDRLVERLVNYGEPEGVCGRLGMGMFLLRRVFEGCLGARGNNLQISFAHKREGKLALRSRAEEDGRQRLRVAA
jgi:hypothetical protein